MRVFKVLDDGLSRFTEWILAFGTISMVIILIVNIISRRVFEYSLPVADELGASLIILTTFAGIGYAARKGRHIRMSALFDLFPKQVQKVVIIFSSLVTFVVYCYVVYIAIRYIQYTIMLGRVTPAMEIPAWIQQLILPIGFFLGAMQYLLNALLNLKEPEVYIGTEKSVDETGETV